jgi:hypothetical protein
MSDKNAPAIADQLGVAKTERAVPDKAHFVGIHYPTLVGSDYERSVPICGEKETGASHLVGCHSNIAISLR